MAIKNKGDLPDEIIREILSRIPLQSLCEIRFVSKLWNQIITETTFSKISYTQLCNRHSNSTNTTSLIVSDRSQLYYIPDFHKKKIFKLKNLPYDPSRRHTVAVVGSCNGFVCFTHFDHKVNVYIGNPLIGDYELVPDGGDYEPAPTLFGFGYEKRKDEYKVVRMRYEENDQIGIQICTVGIKDWRHVGYVKGILKDWTGSVGVLFSGKLHWLGFLKGNTCVSIVAVNLLSEKIEDLGFVDKTVGNVSKGFYLGVLDELMCIFDDSKLDCVNIWVMRVYVDWNSLEKRYVIKRPPTIRMRHKNGFKPLLVKDNGDILFQQNGGWLVCHNPKRSSSFKGWFQMIKWHASQLYSTKAFLHVSNRLKIKEAVRTPSKGELKSKEEKSL